MGSCTTKDAPRAIRDVVYDGIVDGDLSLVTLLVSEKPGSEGAILQITHPSCRIYLPRLDLQNPVVPDGTVLGSVAKYTKRSKCAFLRLRGGLRKSEKLTFQHDVELNCRNAFRRESICAKIAAARDPPEAKGRLRQGNLTVHVATMNLGEKRPIRSQMKQWLGPDASRGADLIFVAAQESNYRASPSTDSDWRSSVAAALSWEDPCHTMVESATFKDEFSGRETRVGLWVRDDCAHRIGDVAIATAAGVGRNKGGLAISLRYDETPLCFVGVHLAADQENVVKRGEDLCEILEGLFLGIETEFTHVFLAGDLNYRIDTVADSQEVCPDDPAWRGVIWCRHREEVLAKIQAGRFSDLRRDDQLCKAMGRVPGYSPVHPLLPSFEEASDPGFPPTFKRQTNQSGAGDPVHGYNLQRVPAWCGRVLYSRVFAHEVDDSVETLAYDSVNTSTTSDHKPVFATFALHTRLQFIHPEVPNRYVMQLTKLSAAGLIEADGPSLGVVTNLCPKQVPRTDVAPRTCDPVWPDVLTLAPAFDVTYLEQEYLALVVMDLSTHPMGQGVLPLAGRLDGRAHAFTVDVVLHGVKRGTISGVLTANPRAPGDSEAKTGCSTPALWPEAAAAKERPCNPRKLRPSRRGSGGAAPAPAAGRSGPRRTPASGSGLQRGGPQRQPDGSSGLQHGVLSAGLGLQRDASHFQPDGGSGLQHGVLSAGLGLQRGASHFQPDGGSGLQRGGPQRQPDGSSGLQHGVLSAGLGLQRGASQFQPDGGSGRQRGDPQPDGSSGLQHGVLSAGLGLERGASQFRPIGASGLQRGDPQRRPDGSSGLQHGVLSAGLGLERGASQFRPVGGSAATERQPALSASASRLQPDGGSELRRGSSHRSLSELASQASDSVCDREPFAYYTTKWSSPPETARRPDIPEGSAIFAHWEDEWLPAVLLRYDPEGAVIRWEDGALSVGYIAEWIRPGRLPVGTAVLARPEPTGRERAARILSYRPDGRYQVLWDGKELTYGCLRPDEIRLPV
eukprot:TRINITY_DN3372_c0_g1_i6.p1 TRINITY_DN3372_c0_g1~~TRINITY_DN3372_c0_g1_i6.p1  ORF type:complete len:1036 (+),score=142.92 TRINITY_DN3372_c0_g1_i6:59-3109(+)